MSKSIETFHSDLLGESYRLIHHSSGLPIYIFPKRLTTAYALFAVDFGAIDRTDAIGGSLPAGVAHFLEHKLFTDEDGTDSFERFSALGADANAYTAANRTVYLFSATERFADSFRELLHFVTHPAFPKEGVDRERGIITEEILQTGDNPYNRAYYNMLSGLYENHPVRDEICGTVSSISEITPEVLYRAYDAYYHPANMALIVCGDVDEDEILRITDETLPRNASVEKPKRRAFFEAAHACKPYAESFAPVAKPIFCIGVKDVAIPKDPHERARKDAGMAVLAEMLFSQSGELFNRLYCRGAIGAELSADYNITESFAFLRIFGEAEDPREVFREICAYIEGQRQAGLSAEEFERCKRVEYAEYIKGFDSTEEIAETMLSFVLDGAELFSYATILQELDLAYIEKLLQQGFDPSYFTLSVIYPEENKEENK